MKSKTADIIKKCSGLTNRRLARRMRIAALNGMIKNAEFGLMQNFMGGVANFDYRETKIMERGGSDTERALYGVTPPGYPEKKDTDISTRQYDRSLSTRYSPDRPGVMTRRIADAVYQDPITGKIYDWNEGFKTESGEEFNGGSVQLQTELHDRMSS